MKIAELRKSIDIVRQIILQAGGHQTAAELRAFDRVFEGHGTKTLDAFVKKAQTVSFQDVRGVGPRMSAIDRVFSDFHNLVSVVSTKTVSRKIGAIHDLIRQAPEVPVEMWVSQVQAAMAATPKRSKRASSSADLAVVDAYVAELNSANGDANRFAATFGKLTSDKKVRKPEAALIALNYIGSGAKSDPKKKSLARLKAQLDLMRDFDAKREASGGRSAA